ncbi:MAG TPA: tetratricopeptide repeat protein [Candidatus Angelobacter sp.]
MSLSPAAAPIRVFISYSHDSPEQMAMVLEFSDKLREDGIDASVDQYEVVPSGGWAVWTETQIRESDFVIVVCTETYLKRAEGREELNKGHGVIWESFLAIQHVYNAAVKDKKFIPILLDGAKPDDIPVPLQGRPYYLASSEAGYEELYRRLTNQPRVKRPVLGKRKSLPPRQRQSQSAKPNKPWNVPQERNLVFTGRDDILAQLRGDLLKYRRQALSGLGGIGKTQIALEYAYRHHDYYTAMLWTFADSEQSVNTGFANFAKLLDLREKESAEQAVIINAVKRWLQENDNWLLVFDNADTPGILAQFLPQQSKGHILLTSRAHVFQNLGILKALEVSVLSPQAAVEFLLKRTAKEGTAESKEAEVLAKELGYLPLALEQAGAYIHENGSSFKDYLSAYQKQRLKVLERQGPALGNPQQQQKRTVATAWEINFADIEKNSPASADLLRLSAFLAPDAIPLELLEKGGDKMGDLLASALAKVKDDPLIVDELLKPLTSYSLIRRNPENRSFSIHPLVQEVVRDGMAQEVEKSWAERTVRGLNSAFPDVQFQNWQDCDRLIAHSLVCAELIAKYNFEFAPTTRLLNQAAFYLVERARYTEAESLYRRALAIREKVLGPEHPDTALSLNNLATLYDDQGKYEEAAPLHRRSLAIREKVLGPEHPHTALSLNNLAEHYRTQGKYEEAEHLYLRALQIDEKALGRDHPDTAVDLNNLAALYYGQSKYAEAEPLYRRSLAISEKVLGLEHPHTARGLNNLANTYNAQRRYEKAEPLHRRAVEIAQKALGPQHPRTILYTNNLIICCRDQGKLKEAEELEKQLEDSK